MSISFPVGSLIYFHDIIPSVVAGHHAQPLSDKQYIPRIIHTVSFLHFAQFGNSDT